MSFVKQNNQEFGYSLTPPKMPLCYNILMDIEPANSLPQVQPSRKSPYKLSRRHKAFADAYLLTLNATEAYKAVFKPKHPEYAYKRAYAVLKDEGIQRYVDEALASSCDSDYRPEAIKQGVKALAMSARRESDRLRAYELMAKISGLLADNVNNTQVNIVTDDIMRLAKKRLSERKESDKSQNVIVPESSEVLETQQDTDTMSYNNNYVPTESESVLSTNEDSSVGKADTIDSSVDGDGGQEWTPRGSGGEGPPPTP